uniref:Si:ch211-221n20.8 n=1 Tax=Cyprinus carpio carpio TaxID=630221 RepID=A0A9J7ZHM1_CYPCA
LFFMMLCLCFSCMHVYAFMYLLWCVSAMCSPPCAHGGSCMRWNVCLCRPGWTGDGCHTAVCELPCANGGRCVAPNTCQCPSDYSGAQCLTPLCSPPCVNGGKCVDINTCSCSDGWTGARCQRGQQIHTFSVLL